MKEGLFCGLVAGVIIGAMMYKHSNDAKKAFDKGEKMAKDELEMLKKTYDKTAKKQAN